MQEIEDRIRRVDEKGIEFPKFFPALAKDLVRKMLIKNPAQRLDI